MKLEPICVVICLILTTGCKIIDQRISQDETSESFPINGYVTGGIGRDKPVLLYNIENETFLSFLENIRYREPIGFTWTEADRIFKFNELTPGKYVTLILHVSYDSNSTPGYPIIAQQTFNNHTVKYVWGGVGDGHSIGIFQITKIENDSSSR